MCPSQSAGLTCLEGFLGDVCNKNVCAAMLTRDGFCLSHLIFPMFGILIHKILTCQTRALTRFGIFKRIGRKCVCVRSHLLEAGGCMVSDSR